MLSPEEALTYPDNEVAICFVRNMPQNDRNT